MEFKAGQFAGTGTRKYKNGNIYTGTFASGVPTGKGALTLASGDNYTGDFAAGKFNGTGTYKFKNGDSYTGEFRDSSKVLRILETDGWQIVQGGYEGKGGKLTQFHVLAWTETEEEAKSLVEKLCAL